MFGTKLQRTGRWIALILLAALLSGCSVSGSVRWEVKHYSVSGRVHLANGGPPVVGAEVFFNGPVDRRVVTDSQGRYGVNLPAGRYNVTIRTLHRTYTDKVTVSGREVINFAVLPSWYDRDVFTALSGIKRYEVRDGRLDWYYGQLARWDQAVVRVYFDTDGAPYRWAEDYLGYIQKWYDLLGRRIRFERTYSDYRADVIVELVPAGSLDPGIAVHTRQAYHGVIEGVRLSIDVSYATDRSLWEHEWAHVMGVHHSFDRQSVMYPAVVWGQRNRLSQLEVEHIQLMYDLQPGLAIGSPWSAMAAHDGEEQESEFVQIESGWTYSGHMRTEDGETISLPEYEAERLFFGW